MWERLHKRPERKRKPKLEPVVTVCPADILPLVTQLVDNDADRLFLIAWNWCGQQVLRNIISRRSAAA